MPGVREGRCFDPVIYPTCQKQGWKSTLLRVCNRGKCGGRKSLGSSSVLGSFKIFQLHRLLWLASVEVLGLPSSKGLQGRAERYLVVCVSQSPIEQVCLSKQSLLFPARSYTLHSYTLPVMSTQLSVSDHHPADLFLFRSSALPVCHRAGSPWGVTFSKSLEYLNVKTKGLERYYKVLSQSYIGLSF